MLPVTESMKSRREKCIVLIQFYKENWLATPGK